MTALLRAEGVTKRFGGFTALDAVHVEVQPGERLGLIGPNGSGKSTLVNCITGVLRNEAGSVVFDGENVTGLTPHKRARRGIVRTFQIPKPFGSMTVLENLVIPLEYAGREWAHPERVLGEAMEVLELIGLAAKADERSSGLTQVDMRKLELARALAAKPKLLISDEAMAGLSTNEVDEVIAILFKLNERGITIVMIEHIMRAVMRFSQRIVVLDAGKKIADDKPEAVVRNPLVEKAYLGE